MYGDPKATDLRAGPWQRIMASDAREHHRWRRHRRVAEAILWRHSMVARRRRVVTSDGAYPTFQLSRGGLWWGASQSALLQTIPRIRRRCLQGRPRVERQAGLSGQCQNNPMGQLADGTSSTRGAKSFGPQGCLLVARRRPMSIAPPMGAPPTCLPNDPRLIRHAHLFQGAWSWQGRGSAMPSLRSV